MTGLELCRKMQPKACVMAGHEVFSLEARAHAATCNIRVQRAATASQHR